MMLGIPTPAARPAPATTEPFRNSRRVTAMTSPFLCAVGAALRASVRRRSDGGCGPARSRAGSVAALTTDDVVRSAPGGGASDVRRLILGNSGHYEEDAWTTAYSAGTSPATDSDTSSAREMSESVAGDVPAE